MTAEEGKATAALAASDIRISYLDRSRAAHLMGLALGVGLTNEESILLMAERLSQWRRDDAGLS